MAPALSKLNAQYGVAAAGSGAALAIYLMYRKQTASTLKPSATVPQFLKEEEKAKKKSGSSKAQVNREFFKQLWRLLKICIPGFFSMETLYLFVVAASLLGRTYADVWMITNTTLIENGIIQRNNKIFLQYVTKYAMAMPAISVINNLLKFGLSELRLRFRTRLSKFFYDQYLKLVQSMLTGFTFYKMSNLDNRVANADQILTQDVEKFCAGFVDLYSNLSKPVVDVTLYVFKLGTALGFQAPLKLFAYLILSGLLLTRLRQPIGRMTVTEQQLEGEYRFVNSRLIVNSEEIAFYKGAHRERETIHRSFSKLVTHLRKLILFRFNIGFVDNIVAKYIATVVGFFVVSRPFLDKSNNEFNQATKDELMQVYYTNGRMMFALAGALGRLALAGREMTRLAGFTARMTELLNVLADLNAGRYERTMLGGDKVGSSSAAAISTTPSKDGDNDDDSDEFVQVAPLIPGSGKLVIQDHIIKFEHVPLVTPNGDVLVNELNFEVRSGVNVLVCGPNGCGKSSLFRILGELWPLFGGTLTKPDKRNLFYIPQRPYMTLGSLRDQIIYPDSKQDMRDKGFNDEYLEQFLDLVQLRYVLSREQGWDSVQDWMDVLSGGEKQRIAMARLFYHQPQFAILDECTSAVSMDVEGSMYDWCRKKNITLFTVSHRKSLWRHHEFYLYMDGRGKFDFKPIDESTEQFGS